MKKKIRVGIIFGGKSVEHEVSLQSAKSIVEAMDKNKYEIMLIGVDKEGQWHLQKSTDNFLLNSSNTKTIKLNKPEADLAVVPEGERKLISKDGKKSLLPVDVVFPLVHGGIGEDGSLQGLLKILDVPFVGPSVLGSALGMDKDVMKRLWREAGLPVAKHLAFHAHEENSISFGKVKKELGLPLFVKPANTGSSVGISKVKSEKEFYASVKHAFLFDSKIVIEEFIKGREIEVAVLGNENPVASVPGEVIPSKEFYSYEAKYIDEQGATLAIPAKLPKSTVKKLQDLAVKAFEVLECEGMARVDFFVTESKILLNEVNTIPGFTKISMYPKLWEASGVKYSDLIDELIQLAIYRHERGKKIKTSIG